MKCDYVSYLFLMKKNLYFHVVDALVCLEVHIWRIVGAGDCLVALAQW